jgi:hypothetical protein
MLLTWPSSDDAAAVDTERDTSADPETPELSDKAFPSSVVAELASCVWLYRPPSECEVERPAACPVVVVASAPPVA